MLIVMYRRYLQIFVIFRIFVAARADESAIVRDYFAHRKITSVVAFSCENVKTDVKLAKSFSDMRIFSAISKAHLTTKSMHTLQQLLSANYHRIGIFVDTRCDHRNFTSLLFAAAKYRMYDEMHKWFIISDNLKESTRMIDDSAFTISTDLVIAVPSTHGYILYDVYNICKNHGGSLNVIFYGTWHEKTGLYVILTEQKFSRRANLRGMTLKVGVLLDHKPKNMSLDEYLSNNSVNSKDNHSKFLYAIILNLADLFNFTLTVTEIDPWKKRNNRGPVFTAFEEGSIDICANPTTMIAERLDYGDIIAPVWPVRTCFLFRTISSTQIRSTQFVRPLSTKVWYAMSIVLLFTMFLLLIALKLEGIRNLTELYGSSVLFAIGALSQQAAAFVPYGVGARIAFLHVMCFSLIIFNYYNASVVSDRLRNTRDKMNDSLISLANSNYEIAMEPTQYINALLQEPHMEVRYFYQNRWLKLPESTRHLTVEEGLDRVANGGFAYHTLTESAYPYIKKTFKTRMICELTEVHLLRSTLALWTRRNSSFTKLLRVGMTKVNNMGLRDRQLKYWSAKKPLCPSNMLLAEAVSIYEAAPILMFLVVGMIVSFSMCAMENLIFWLWSSRSSIIVHFRKGRPSWNEY